VIYAKNGVSPCVSAASSCAIIVPPPLPPQRKSGNQVNPRKWTGPVTLHRVEGGGAGVFQKTSSVDLGLQTEIMIMPVKTTGTGDRNKESPKAKENILNVIERN